ncbi:MAG: DUF167 domain-containing protein [SAR202 cluster bacterium]|nr:DUF167 domain-containing protein [SAR202 cluster bacterium]
MALSRLTIVVRPKANRNTVVIDEGEAIKVQVTAAPSDGAANAAVESLLADALGVARRDVRVVRGRAARVKQVEVPLEKEEALRRLRGA